KIAYRDVYPGVDLLFYGNQRQLEYDFVVAPAADPAAIRLAVEGADRLSLDADGHLVAALGRREVRMQKPVVYQTVAGARREVPGRFVLASATEVAFDIGAYDRTQPLVIDPLTTFFNDLGGSGDDIIVGVVDAGSGRAYVAGVTTSADLPAGAALDGSANGGLD